jgi:anti-sigma factor ChrR (cupin superfamily)
MTYTTPGADMHDSVAELGSRYVDIDSLEWSELPFKGVTGKILLQDTERGVMTAFVRMEPGAEIPHHEHTGLEQSYVLEGSLVDDDGVCSAGQYVWRPKGNRHVARSPNGALMLVMFEAPNIYFDGLVKGKTVEQYMAEKAAEAAEV